MFSKISLFLLIVTFRRIRTDKIQIYQNKIIEDISSRIKAIANNTFSYINKNEHHYDISHQCLSTFIF